jgi:hypothetical protein
VCVHPCLIPDFNGNTFSFSPLSMMLTIGSYMVFIVLRHDPSIPSFIRAFFLFLLYSYVHAMFGSFLPPSPAPSLTPCNPSPTLPNPSLPGRNYFAFIFSFVEERV